MSNNNKTKFIENSSNHITNINRVLENIKSEVMEDIICSNQTSATIVMNKVVLPLDLQMIEKYIKSTNHIEAEDVKVSCLPQLKSYLKIIDIPYLGENTSFSIIADIVKDIIKKNHIFNNIAIVSRPCIIKVSPKSDIAIIWLDI